MYPYWQYEAKCTVCGARPMEPCAKLVADVRKNHMPSEPKFYPYTYKGIRLDPYRIADVYGITNHAQFSALKKVLCAGGRGAKNREQDIREAIVALERMLEMAEEDEG